MDSVDAVVIGAGFAGLYMLQPNEGIVLTLFVTPAALMAIEMGRDNACFIHLTLVPYIASAGEIKTKPTQHSVKELREIGIQPDVLLCRADRPLPDDERFARLGAAIERHQTFPEGTNLEFADVETPSRVRACRSFLGR